MTDRVADNRPPFSVVIHVTVFDLDDSSPVFVGSLPSESSFLVQEAEGDQANVGVFLSQVILVQDPDQQQPEEYTYNLIR